MKRKTLRFILLYFLFLSALAGSIIGYYYFKRKKTKRHHVYNPPSLRNDYRIPPLFVNHPLGMDISKYQGHIQWAQVKNDTRISFVYIKSTEGASLKDSRYNYNYRECRKQGIACGAYHYFKPHISGKKQAIHFIRNTQFNRGDMLPVLDVEERHRSSRATLHEEINAFVNTVKAELGVKVIIYSGSKFYKTHLKSAFSHLPLWVAHYSTSDIRKHHASWHFWQFTDRGKVKGVPGNVDLNIFSGTKENLENYKIR